MKFCTSAPFAAALKADVLARWPGGLVEFYGMTEGGGTCILEAHEHPDKLHTVGPPSEGHDIRLIDEAGDELPPGVDRRGRRPLAGNDDRLPRPARRRPPRPSGSTPAGKRFIRTGDVGRFDDDGFLTLLDRRKDMIISGGFNIYPSDLEAVLREHPDVADAAVVGVPSERWGETPVGLGRAAPRRRASSREALRAWANERVGKTQRLADLRLVDELPRSAIGKVLKRELRERWLAAARDRWREAGPPRLAGAPPRGDRHRAAGAVDQAQRRPRRQGAAARGHGGVCRRTVPCQRAGHRTGRGPQPSRQPGAGSGGAPRLPTLPSAASALATRGGIGLHGAGGHGEDDEHAELRDDVEAGRDLEDVAQRRRVVPGPGDAEEGGEHPEEVRGRRPAPRRRSSRSRASGRRGGRATGAGR